MGKYFIIDPKVRKSEKDTLDSLQRTSENIFTQTDISLAEKRKQKIQEEDNLVHTHGRIVVKIDMDMKNSWTFEDGTKIRYERGFNNFNQRESKPVNAIVISGEGIPKGSEILISHKATHETNRINDYKNSFETEESDKVRYFSLPDYECFAWRVGKDEWKPIPPFEFALRVFKPYEGLMQGIDPIKMENILYCTTGELKGNVLKTLKGVDYEIVFQASNGKEGSLIRFRPFGDSKTLREEEAIAILNDYTDMVNDGKLLVGYTLKDAKKINNAN